ncbi:hypothetical protein [Streptomyces eurythermus]|uniref:hypothetical protein n=1 Tax=Streptomyces eurythermus TaxID=42237 RepID=UPI003F4CCC55
MRLEEPGGDRQGPVYGTLMADQLDTAVEQRGKSDLAALLAGCDTWTVVGGQGTRP